MRLSTTLCSGFLLLAGLAGQLAAKDSPLEPAAFWSFNRCALDGDLILDSGPGAYDLTLRGPFCASGRYGLAVRFDGVDDIAESEPNVLNFDDQLTMTAWVDPDSVDGVQTIVNKWFAFDSYSLAIHEGRFAFTVAFRGGGPWGHTVDVRAPATADRWTHLAGVFDGKAGTASLYLDGVLAATETAPRKHLQQSTRPVAVGNHPDWNPFRGKIDEVGLYDAALTAEQVRSVAGINASPFHGADTSVKPKNQYPDGKSNGYDFYIGRLGFSRYPCTIQDRRGYDILTWERGDPDEKCIFVYEAATIARPERTYAYWWLVGPAHGDASRFGSPFAFGAAQAGFLIDRWRTYRHLIGGHTLFADVERSRTPPDTSGWEICWPGEIPTGACARNREVLEGFLQTIAAAPLNLTPGVYTRDDIWREFFGDDYLPDAAGGGTQPFALWLTGCNTSSGCGKARPAAEIEALLPTVEDTVLGGMRTVIWQHHVNCADFDAASQRPSGSFTPSPDPGGRPFYCTCDQIGGSC